VLQKCGSFIPQLHSIEAHAGKKLLINTMLKRKPFERRTPELGPIVTVNSFQVAGLLIVQPESQAPKEFNTSSFLSKKKTQE
jgi:hypothetical protein